MDKLIIALLRGEAADIQVQQLRHWRAESAENERSFQEILRLWQRTADLNEPRVSPPPALEKITAGAESRRRSVRRKATGRTVLASRWTAYGLAVAAVVALVFVGVRSSHTPGPVGSTLVPMESSSGLGDAVTMSLSDGSVIRVAADTRIEFPPTLARREVVLEGRAFFAVAAHELPFVVRTRVGDVTVRGTRFEVLSDGGQLRVVVVEGVVRLDAAGESTQVSAGQVAFLAAGSSPRVVDREDLWTLLDWAGGLLVFQATPLSMVTEEMGRRFGRPVRVTGQELLNRRVTAWFEDESLDEVVSAVCLVVGARCEVSESEVTIGR